MAGRRAGWGHSYYLSAVAAKPNEEWEGSAVHELAAGYTGLLYFEAARHQESALLELAA